MQARMDIRKRVLFWDFKRHMIQVWRTSVPPESVLVVASVACVPVGHSSPCHKLVHVIFGLIHTDILRLEKRVDIHVKHVALAALDALCFCDATMPPQSTMAKRWQRRRAESRRDRVT